MYELGMVMALMFTGAAFVFLTKGALEVRATGDNWKILDFFRSNANRLILLALLLFVASIAMWLDPAGIAEIFATLPVGIQVSSPFMLGAGLSGFVMVLNRNAPPPPLTKNEEEEKA